MFKMKRKITAMAMAVAMAGSVFCGTGSFNPMPYVQAAEAGETVFESSSCVAQEVDFSGLTEEDWNNKAEVVYAYTNEEDLSAGENFTLDAKITISADDYAVFGEDSYIKFQGVVKLTEDWTYTNGDSWPMLTKADFAEDGDGYSASVQVEFRDKEPLKLMEVDYEIVGVGFKGTVNISEVKVTNVSTEEPELAAAEPIVLSDLESEDDFKLWGTETGWDYFHGGTANSVPDIEYDSENGRLKVSVDYSANESSTWSEAKVKFTPAEAADLSSYNQLSVDIIYPDSLDGAKMKFFSNAGIEKDTTIDETTAEDLGDGMKKVTVTMGFSPTSAPLDSLTIGIVGCQTSFAGDVYLDNLVLSQANPTADFVEITAVPDEEEVCADLSKAPETVILSDAEATDSAKALYAYLFALAESDQVLFGHQNDVSRSVGQNELGDVYDVTGSVSGVFGIDSLALVGSEASGTDAVSALENSVNYSKTAAENGAIITLSTHMPNFTNSKVVKNEDGTYDFFSCDFAESKDTSNDSVKKILPGGECNEAFTAYLDIIADYALQLQEENIPIIFRPFHENTGSWFWWGSSNAEETYKSLFRYTRDYLEAKGVHNMLYVYSPGGPLTSEEEYLTRYPGDEYVDILAFDYYDDYNTYPASSDGSFFTHLDETCQVVSALAAEKGKVAAISETGVRVMKQDGSDNEGLLVTGNPVSGEASGTNWYAKVSEIARENNMPYYLVWANFSDTNFYVPYKYDDTYGHEIINEFIEYYNEDSSVFGAQTGFYENMESLASGTAAEVDGDAAGYMVYPFELDTVMEPTVLSAAVKNAAEVQFVVEANDVQVELTGVEDADAGLYTAELTQEDMDTLGACDAASIALVADGTEVARVSNISLGKEKEQAAANVFENYDLYSGENSLIDAAYSQNSAAGCSSEFLLDETDTVEGTYGGAFHYVLSTTGSEVWTGRVKTELAGSDFSAYNAIQMWVKPDGMGQKLVIQIADDSGEEFEVFLTDFAGGTEAQWVTIPFVSFVGKQNGTLNTANITKFAIYCNSIIPEDHEGDWNVDSTIYFDGIEAVNVSEENLAAVDASGLIITDDSLAE